MMLLLLLVALCAHTSDAVRGSRVTIYNDTPYILRIMPMYSYRGHFPDDRVFLQPGWSTVLSGYNDGMPPAVVYTNVVVEWALFPIYYSPGGYVGPYSTFSQL